MPEFGGHPPHRVRRLKAAGLAGGLVLAGLGTLVGLSSQSAAGSDDPAVAAAPARLVSMHVDPMARDAVGREVAIDRNVFLSAIAWQQAVAQAQAEQQAAAQAAAASGPAPQSSSSVSSGGDPLSSEPASVQATFACIRAHESDGNYGAVNGYSGAGGAYQFMPSTWASLGGSGLPEYASAAEQDAMAVRAYEADGWSPWSGDACV